EDVLVARQPERSEPSSLARFTCLLHLTIDRGLAGALDGRLAALLHPEHGSVLRESLAGQREALGQLHRLAVELQERGLGLRIETDLELRTVRAFIVVPGLVLCGCGAGREHRQCQDNTFHSNSPALYRPVTPPCGSRGKCPCGRAPSGCFP